MIPRIRKPIGKLRIDLAPALAYVPCVNLKDGLWSLMSRLLPATKSDIARIERLLMATQKELADQLKAVAEQQTKTLAEIASVQSTVTALNTEVARLNDIIAAGGEVTQELIDSVTEVKRLAQLADDQIPDLTPPPTT